MAQGEKRKLSRLKQSHYEVHHQHFSPKINMCFVVIVDVVVVDVVVVIVPFVTQPASVPLKYLARSFLCSRCLPFLL